MKNKKKTRKSKVHRYLYKNSYLYKWGTRILRSKIGRILVILIVAGLALHLGFRFYKNQQVKSFLIQWQNYQNNQQFSEFMNCLDTSAQNPYKNTFPDWEEQFFDIDMKMILKDISVSKIGMDLYEAAAVVIFQQGEQIANQFAGLIYVSEEKKFKIIRVEI
jgi:hypothetical protein